MKQFGRRLLNKSRFLKSPSAKQLGSSNASATAPTILSSSSSESSSGITEDGSFENDAYADVRHQLEALSARDKARYATHSSLEESAHPPDTHSVPWFVAYTCYLGYAILLLVGHARDFVGSLLNSSRFAEKNTHHAQNTFKNYAPLLGNWEKLYVRRIYARVQDCFNRPVASAPAKRLLVLERNSCDGQKSMQLASSTKDYVGGAHYVALPNNSPARNCLNLGSYNYLGFADDWQQTCGADVLESLQHFSVSTGSCRGEYGTTRLHRELEQTVADFVGKQDALVLNMGYNTNATTIPALVGRGDLIVSDALNHTSIVAGARASGAAIRIFKHNDVADLNQLLRQAIIMGRPRTRRPWNKILVVIEGVYSMEGEYCDLKQIVQVCKQYGAFVYLDEAHSIGAMGPTGRGCAEYCGVDPNDIDIMMGTFTKSFGAMGGYVAASKEVIDYLRKRCAGSAFHTSMSPIVCQQVLSAFKVCMVDGMCVVDGCEATTACQMCLSLIALAFTLLQVIMGNDGTDIGRRKIQALRDNSNYFRMRLHEMGLKVLGQYDSPVVPVMVYHMSKMGAFSRECWKRGIAIVVVGAPAVPLLECRARFCMSAGLTRADIDWALGEINKIADAIVIKHGQLQPQSATAC
jgi:serine palmitoyltransferase